MGESQEKENKKLKREVSNALSPKGWKERTEHVCKPCWELKYCPYGRIVELFPIAEDEIVKQRNSDGMLNQPRIKGGYLVIRMRKELFLISTE